MEKMKKHQREKNDLLSIYNAVTVLWLRMKCSFCCLHDMLILFCFFLYSFGFAKIKFSSHFRSQWEKLNLPQSVHHIKSHHTWECSKNVVCDKDAVGIQMRLIHICMLPVSSQSWLIIRQKALPIVCTMHTTSFFRYFFVASMENQTLEIESDGNGVWLKQSHCCKNV